MIKLINRGKYGKPIQDEFEHLTNRLSTFLGQIFDEDGVYIPPDGGGGSGLVNIASAVKRTKHGDLAINHGAVTGTSVLPWPVDLNKTLLINLGAESANDPVIFFTPGSNVQLSGKRTNSTGNGIIYYVVMEFW